jgi:hypothetical protein
MILYQLAKWFEERKRLAATIRETDGDTSFLLHKKELVDQQIITHANKWLGPNNDELLLPIVDEMSALEATQELAN